MVIVPNKIIIPNGESLNENFSANESSFKITKRYLFRNCSVKIFQRLFFYLPYLEHKNILNLLF